MTIFPKRTGKRQTPAKTVDQAMEVFRAIDPKAIECMASQRPTAQSCSSTQTASGQWPTSTAG